MSESESKLIAERAHELGFDHVGIVPLAPPQHLPAFDAWLAQGRHGEMGYMARHRDLRADPIALHPGARSAVVVGLSHRPADDDESPGGVARYARGSDYHKILRRRLAQLGRFIASEFPDAAISPRAFSDSAPVMERDLAERAGIGWFGKSSNIISQDLGSYLFLGELFVGRDLAPIGTPAPDRCGRCSACVDLCPTGAIVGPYEVDSRLCISYLTIELKGPIPRPLRPLIGDHLFGCDICQIVCPWNHKAPPLREAAFRPRPEVLNLTAADCLRLSQPEFEVRFAGMAIRRAGREGLSRNATVVMGNSGDPRAIPDLIAALRADESPLVRGHAAWALGQLGESSARSGLELARMREESAVVRGEIEAALEEHRTSAR